MKRNKFSLSHSHLTSFDMGYLVPLSVFDVLPGDSVQMNTNALIRCSPLLAPVMHRVDVRIHHWYVPWRLIWDDFEDFITGGPDGDDSSVWPYRDYGAVTVAVGHILERLGMYPAGTYPAASLRVSALPLRAYNLIWNEFYRDQDLQSEISVVTTSGSDSSTTEMQRVNWEKDYFTSSRPWEQKGPSITIPLGDTAPVVGTGGSPNFTGQGKTNAGLAAASGDNILRTGGGNYTTSGALVWGDDPALEADLSSSSAVTINLLREAFGLQKYAEARARFGSRYTEYLRYYGVISPDSRLQRPEYLGGGRQTVQFSEVLQTGPGTDPVGDMKGHGIAGARSNRWRRFFSEHGQVLSLISVVPKTIYRQGIHRSHLRVAKEDVWTKELEAIGQQEVKNAEVYGISATPSGVFGYQDRYDEYRRAESRVTGQFGSSLLNHWHLAREFASAPALNSDFVECEPTDRVFAVPSEDVLFCMAHHSIQARRMVARTGESGVRF